jgi:hypothetical protein
VLEFKKIYQIDKKTVGPLLGAIFTNISLLLGIREPISKINKEDILRMILTHYKKISLEEIVYAFELERYGKFKTKSKHFQNFNAEYVAEVLIKYKDWLAQTRFDNNLPISKKRQIPKETISEAQKNEIMKQGSLRCFNEFKETGHIQDGNTHIYDHLIKDLKLHKFTDEEIEAAKSIAERKLKEEAKTFDRYKAKSILSSIKNKNYKPIINKAKLLLLESFFLSLGDKHLKELL